jgi:hypothetical protein
MNADAFSVLQPYALPVSNVCIVSSLFQKLLQVYCVHLKDAFFRGAVINKGG